MERAEAVLVVLRVLRNPILLMTIPSREEAQRLAKEFSITAEELLLAARRKVRDES